MTEIMSGLSEDQVMGPILSVDTDMGVANSWVTARGLTTAHAASTVMLAAVAYLNARQIPVTTASLQRTMETSSGGWIEKLWEGLLERGLIAKVPGAVYYSHPQYGVTLAGKDNLIQLYRQGAAAAVVRGGRLAQNYIDERDRMSVAAVERKAKWRAARKLP